MEFKDEVCSLELSKKLEELGFKQESLFWWTHYTHEGSRKMSWEVEDYEPSYTDGRKKYSAYTTRELGEMLPDKYSVSKVGGDGWFCYKYDNKYNLSMTKILGMPEKEGESNARATLLIYLKENNLI